MMAIPERKTKEERREEILDAALVVFAEQGPARRLDRRDRPPRRHLAAVRLPALRDEEGALPAPCVARCFRQTLEIFQRAAEGKRGEEALHAIGAAYGQLLRGRPDLPARADAGLRRLRDPEICAVVRNGFGDLVTYVERVSGVDARRARRLLRERDADERARLDATERPGGGPWAQRLARRLQAK